MMFFLWGMIGATLCWAAPTTQPTPAAVITIRGTIDDSTRDALTHHIAEARAAGAKTIILRMDTYGGLVTAALDISRQLKQLSDLHTVALIDNKAISAGAMIAMACDEIVMTPSAVLGDSAPISVSPEGGMTPMPAAERAKLESPILADFYDSAVRHGYDPQLAEAMVAVGRSVWWVQNEAGTRKFVSAWPMPASDDGHTWKLVEDVPEPVDGPDTLLTVHTDLAVKLGLAKGVIASADALAAERGYTIVAEYAPTYGDTLINLLGSAAVRGILLVIFMQCLYIALHAPGHGVAEAVAVTSLAVLVGVPLLTGYAQWWEVLLILAGLSLVAFEIFVFPGHMVSITAGTMMILVGLVLTFVGNMSLPGFWRLPGTWTAVQNGLLVVVGGLVVSLALSAWLRRFLPNIPYLRRLILAAPQGGIGAPAWPTVGCVGQAVTSLRPGGSVRFSDVAGETRTVAVVSDAGFVEPGTNVVIQEVGGNRILVRPVV